MTKRTLQGTLAAALVLAVPMLSPGSDTLGSALERCATPDAPREAFPTALQPPGPADCSDVATAPPLGPLPTELLTVPVVVHVIMDAACSQGAVSDALVLSQIDVLNEDFLSLPGSPGDPGADTRIAFMLATEDPAGQPTTGITRDCNTTWYNDQGSYWDTLAWDPHRYLNLYTNTANGARGYVPFLPADAGGSMVGTAADRVVINWLAFGRPGPFPPYDQGRTTVHEVGHYMGLYHPYRNGCGVATRPGCYTSGDLLCDTRPDATSHHGCAVGETSCGGYPVPAQNYMELSDDSCMTGFTHQQMRRMHCTLTWYRAQLPMR